MNVINGIFQEKKETKSYVQSNHLSYKNNNLILYIVESHNLNFTLMFS